MRKLFLLFVLSALFFSCSNVAEVVETTEEITTLKDVIVTKESDISWTKELEGERLLQYTYKDEEHIRTNISLTPEVVSIACKDSPAVYPTLDGFGSLDITDLSSNIKYVAEDFCKAVSKNIYQGPQAYFDSDYIFNYVFFKNDLINSWKNRFGVDFPQKIDADEKADAEDKSEKKDSKKSKKQKMPELFTKWIFGRPFIGEEIVQLPVRFYCQQGFVDVTLYIAESSNKIYQILEAPYDGEK